MKKVLLSCFCIALSQNLYALSLEESLIHAYQNNPQILAKREETKVGDEKIAEAISGFLPSIYYTQSKTQTKNNYYSTYNKYNLSPGTTTNDKTQGITMKQELFSSGSGILQIEYAKQSILVNRLNLELTETEVLYNVISAYTEVVIQQKKLDAHKENIDRIKEHVTAVRAKFNAGLEIISNVALEEQEYVAAKADYIVAKNQLITAKLTFKQVVGIDAENLEPIKELENLPKDIDEAMKIATYNNPNLSIAKLYKDITRTKFQLAAAGFGPTLSLESSIQSSYSKFDPGSLNIASKENDNLKSKSVALSLTVPIYNKGLEFSAVRGARATQAQYQNSYTDTSERVKKDTLSNWGTLNAAKSEYVMRIEALGFSAQALDGVLQQYNEGFATIADLLNYQRTHFRNKLLSLNTESSLITSSYKLKYILGQLTAKGLALSTEYYDPIKNYDKVKFRFIGF